MHCSISVVSKKSGLLFEERLIERFISDHGKCPVTEEPLTKDGILPIKTGKIAKVRTVQAASVPGTLGMFQIIGAEDDELGPDGKIIHPEISQSIISELANCNTLPSQQRKNRQIPSTLASIDAMQRYTQINVNPLHKTDKSGILSLDIQYSKQRSDSPSRNQAHLLALDNDIEINGFQVEDISGSSEGYMTSAFHPDLLILGTGSTGVVNIWDVKCQVNIVRFDGHIGATAAQDSVKLWDLHRLGSFKTCAPFDENTPIHSGKTTSVKFGEDAKYIPNIRIFGLPEEQDPSES